MAPGCGASVKDVLEPSGRVGSVAAVGGKIKRCGGVRQAEKRRPRCHSRRFVSPGWADYNSPPAVVRGGFGVA